MKNKELSMYIKKAAQIVTQLERIKSKRSNSFVLFPNSDVEILKRNGSAAKSQKKMEKQKTIHLKETKKVELTLNENSKSPKRCNSYRKYLKIEFMFLLVFEI